MAFMRPRQRTKDAGLRRVRLAIIARQTELLGGGRGAEIPGLAVGRRGRVGRAIVCNIARELLHDGRTIVSGSARLQRRGAGRAVGSERAWNRRRRARRAV